MEKMGERLFPFLNISDKKNREAICTDVYEAKESYEASIVLIHCHHPHMFQ